MQGSIIGYGRRVPSISPRPIKVGWRRVAFDANAKLIEAPTTEGEGTLAVGSALLFKAARASRISSELRERIDIWEHEGGAGSGVR